MKNSTLLEHKKCLEKWGALQYRKNANHLLKLRLLKLNGGWDHYWKERRKEFARHATLPYHGKREAYIKKKGSSPN